MNTNQSNCRCYHKPARPEVYIWSISYHYFYVVGQIGVALIREMKTEYLRNLTRLPIFYSMGICAHDYQFKMTKPLIKILFVKGSSNECFLLDKR